MSIILGIDPGSIKTGYGLINVRGNSIVHIDNGLIIPPKNISFPERISYIFKGICKIMEEFSPTALSMENIFVGKNADSALKLGHVRGAAMAAATIADIAIFEYSPTQVKKSVTGNGRATKDQIQIMIKTMMALREVPYEDAADALAAAVTHAFFGG